MILVVLVSCHFFKYTSNYIELTTAFLVEEVGSIELDLLIKK